MSNLIAAEGPPGGAPKKARLEFIDLLRGLAVIVMIETHVTNALLAQVFRDMGWFDYIDFMNGLVAPSFLFCAGCGVWIALGRKWEDYVGLRKPVWVYFRRLGWILGVAYALHLPNFSLSQMMNHLTPKEAADLFQFDVLHVIVATLAFVVLLAIVTRNKQVVLWSAIGLALILVGVAPAVWEYARMDGRGLLVRNLLTEVPGNYFPVVPWSAFVFIGMAVTQVYMGATDKRVFFVRLFWIGLILFAAGTTLRLTYDPWPFQLWRATPIFFAMRIGIVFMVFAGFWRYTETRKSRPLPAGGLMLTFGRESLLIYVTHLIIVYGSVLNNGIAASLAQTFSPLQTAGVSVGLIALMYLLARAWIWLKATLPRIAFAIPYVWGILFLIYLIKNN